MDNIIDFFKDLSVGWWAIIVAIWIFIVGGIVKGLMMLIKYFMRRYRPDKEEELIKLLDKALDKIPAQLDPQNPQETPEGYEELEKKVQEFIQQGGYLNGWDLLKIGNIEYWNSNIDKAQHYYEVALDWANRNEDIKLKANALGSLGLIFELSD